MSPIRVLISEDHSIVRDGVRMLLQSEPDFVVVAEAANGREAVARAKETLCWLQTSSDRKLTPHTHKIQSNDGS